MRKADSISEPNKVIELFAVVLLSIALQEFFSIISQNVEKTFDFYIIISLVALAYIFVIYGLTFTEIKGKYNVVPRFAVIIILSFLPYTFSRAYSSLTEINQLSSWGVWIYLGIVSLSLIIWGVWEKSKEKWYVDPRFLSGALITALLLLDLTSLVNIIK